MSDSSFSLAGLRSGLAGWFSRRRLPELLEVASVAASLAVAVTGVLFNEAIGQSLETKSVTLGLGLFSASGVIALVSGVALIFARRRGLAISGDTFSKSQEMLTDSFRAYSERFPVPEDKSLIALKDCARMQCLGLCKIVGYLLGIRNGLTADLMIAFGERGEAQALAEKLGDNGDMWNPYGPSADDDPTGLGSDGIDDKNTLMFLLLVSCSVERKRVMLRVARDRDRVIPGAAAAAMELCSQPRPLPAGYVAYDNIDDVQSIPPPKLRAARGTVAEKAVTAFFLTSQSDVQSLVSFGLEMNERVIGVVNLDLDRPNLFTSKVNQHLIIAAVRPLLPLFAAIAAGIKIRMRTIQDDERQNGSGAVQLFDAAKRAEQ